MLGLAGSRYSIMRGSTFNEYGDEVDGSTVVHSAVLGSVVERRRTSYDPQSSRVGTYRELVGRFGHGTDIQDGDRIKDERTGDVFLVTSVYKGSNLVHKSDVVVDLSEA